MKPVRLEKNVAVILCEGTQGYCTMKLAEAVNNHRYALYDVFLHNERLEYSGF